MQRSPRSKEAEIALGTILNIYGNELGSILLRHLIKKYPDLASTRFRIHSVFKNFHFAEEIKKYADMCGMELKGLFSYKNNKKKNKKKEKGGNNIYG